MTATAAPDEIAKFDALAARWWDPKGPMAPLHAMNPLRCGWIADHLARAHGRDAAGAGRADGAGCRLRRRPGVRGPGPAGRPRKWGWTPPPPRSPPPAPMRRKAGWRSTTARACRRTWPPRAPLRRGGGAGGHRARHRSPGLPAAALAGLVQPGGMVFLSDPEPHGAQLPTFAKLGAEYLLRLLPRGTHDCEAVRHGRPAELPGPRPGPPGCASPPSAAWSCPGLRPASPAARGQLPGRGRQFIIVAMRRDYEVGVVGAWDAEKDGQDGS
jgi:2-polyprenyl-6-hydroxyphenyl methylase/3-demethylubiquinone-9 3-methyltransferase